MAIVNELIAPAQGEGFRMLRVVLKLTSVSNHERLDLVRLGLQDDLNAVILFAPELVVPFGGLIQS